MLFEMLSGSHIIIIDSIILGEYLQTPAAEYPSCTITSAYVCKINFLTS